MFLQKDLIALVSALINVSYLQIILKPTPPHTTQHDKVTVTVQYSVDQRCAIYSFMTIGNHTGKQFCDRIINMLFECKITLLFICFESHLTLLSGTCCMYCQVIVRNGLVAFNDRHELQIDNKLKN
jgi:hypothetical protein